VKLLQNWDKYLSLVPLLKFLTGTVGALSIVVAELVPVFFLVDTKLHYYEVYNCKKVLLKTPL
jgi:hypothetical protein